MSRAIYRIHRPEQSRTALSANRLLPGSRSLAQQRSNYPELARLHRRPGRPGVRLADLEAVLDERTNWSTGAGAG